MLSRVAFKGILRPLGSGMNAGSRKMPITAFSTVMDHTINLIFVDREVCSYLFVKMSALIANVVTV